MMAHVQDGSIELVALTKTYTPGAVPAVETSTCGSTTVPIAACWGRAAAARPPSCA